MRRWLDQGLKAQMCITSPPYFGLRDYGVDGQIGLESSFDSFLANLSETFALVRELLVESGTLWLNIGDSYASGGRGGNSTGASSTLKGSLASQEASMVKRSMAVPPGLKPKDLLGQPWRLALALQGFAVMPAASLVQWADWLAEAREMQDWEAVRIVEDRIRASAWLAALQRGGGVVSTAGHHLGEAKSHA